MRLDYTLALEDITGWVTPGDRLLKAVCGICRRLLWRYGRSKADVKRIGPFVREKGSTRLSSLGVTKRFAISLVCFPMEEKRGSALFPQRRLLFKNVRGVALLAEVLAPVPATTVHFDIPRRLIGEDLRLSGTTRLLSNISGRYEAI